MKTKQLLGSISFVLISLFSFNANSQEIISANEIGDKWTSLTTQNGVQLFIKRQDCMVGPLKKPLQYIMIKADNSNNEAKDLYYQIGLHYNEGCIGCGDHPESPKAINLLANSSSECDCDFKKGELSLLIENPNYPYDRIFEGVQLIDIKVD